jgi:hypothetical protein
MIPSSVGILYWITPTPVVIGGEVDNRTGVASIVGRGGERMLEAG